jgi:hypothetical protein
MDFVMLTVARTLSILSIAFTAVFTLSLIGIGRFNLLHLGFEGTGVAVGLSFYFAASFALLTTAIAIALRLRSGASAGVTHVALISVTCLFVLGVVVVMGAI